VEGKPSFLGEENSHADCTLLVRSEPTNLEARGFYSNPYSYLDRIPNKTNHLVLFGDLLSQSSGKESPATTVGTILNKRGWKKAWKSSLNGLDMLQDEEERRGGILVYQRVN